MGLLDLRLALRALFKARLITALAVIALGTGMALATLAFTVTRQLLYARLDVPGGERVVMLREHSRSNGSNVYLDGPDLLGLRSAARSFEDIGVWHSGVATLELSGATLPMRTAHVTANTFGLIGGSAVLGSLPEGIERSAATESALILSFRTWQNHFASDPNIIGRAARVGGHLRTITAVMPDSFGFPMNQDLWIPTVPSDLLDPSTQDVRLHVFGKLRSGISASQAAAEIQSLSERARSSGYNGNDLVAQVVPFTRGFLEARAEPLLWTFVGFLVLVLLVSAANVSSLLVARTSARMNELAIRSALGASRSRLVSQLMLESLLISSVAALLAFLASTRALSEIVARAPALPFWIDFRPDMAVAAFVGLLALLAACAAGLAPALRATSVQVRDVLSSSAAGGGVFQIGPWRRRLVIAEVTLSVGLLGAAAVLGQGLLNFGRADYGLKPREILIAQVFLGRPTSPDLQKFLRETDERRQAIEAGLRSLQGVSALESAGYFPGNDELRLGAWEIESAGEASRRIDTRAVDIGPSYFEVLGARPVVGRVFDERERTAGQPVAVVNSSFVRMHLGGANALGARIRQVQPKRDGTEILGPWLDVVGVVPDLGLNLGDPTREDGVYVPLRQTPFFRVALRAQGETAILIPRVFQAISTLDPRAQVHAVNSMEEQIALSQVLLRAIGVLALVIGGGSSFLALASLFALTSFAVTKRTREIGLRSALGASPTRLLASVFRQELTPLGAGVILGLALGVVFSRLTLFLPVPIHSGNPTLLMAVASGTLLAGLVACLPPARRALSIQPAEALRAD